jgi:hypothetical protein
VALGGQRGVRVQSRWTPACDVDPHAPTEFATVVHVSATSFFCSGSAQPQPKIMCVFSGVHGSRLEEQERDEYDPDVKVVFQRRAWCDSPVIDAWLTRIVAPWCAETGAVDWVLAMASTCARMVQQ